MPLPISSEAIKAKNDLHSHTIWHTLAKFKYKEEPEILICLNNEEIVWDGKTWIPMAFQIGEYEENKEAEIPTMKFEVYDPSRTIFPIVDKYKGCVGATTTIYIVHSENLGTDISEFCLELQVVDSSVLNNYVISFNLGASNLMNYRLPNDVYTRNFCRFAFKDDNCQYSGTEISCNGTVARCRELENALRFGGFPGIPHGAVYV